MYVWRKERKGKGFGEMEGYLLFIYLLLFLYGEVKYCVIFLKFKFDIIRWTELDQNVEVDQVRSN